MSSPINGLASRLAPSLSWIRPATRLNYWGGDRSCPRGSQLHVSGDAFEGGEPRFERPCTCPSATEHSALYYIGARGTWGESDPGGLIREC